MPGLLGGGGGSSSTQYIPYNAGGSGQGGTVYTPMNQPGFDQNYQNLVGTLQNLAFSNQGNGPWEFAPVAGQNALNATPQFNPYAQQQLGGAVTTGDYLSGLGNWMEQATGAYGDIPNLILGQAGAAAGGVAPTQGLAGQAATGIGPTQALAGQAGAGIGPTQALAGEVGSYLPAVSNLASGVASLAPGVTTGIAPLQQGAAQILQTGYDPQSALFNRQRQQSLDASNATNAMYGLGSSPYGAENTAEALNNFNIDWQNQQLARQQAALQAAGTGYEAGGALAGEAGNLLTRAGGLYGLGAGIGGQAGGLYGQAAGQAGQAGGLYGAAAGQAGQAGNLYGSAAGQAGQAANIYGGVVPSTGQLLQLGGAGANTALTGYGLPYSTSVQQAQTALPALQAASNLGLQQALLPQQVLNDIQSYLKLGQSASTISGELGNTGFNQGQAQLGNIGSALSGLGSLVGGATGSNLTGLGGLGAGIGSGISGLGGLFGGGANFGGGVAQDLISGIPGSSVAFDAAGNAIGTDFFSGLADAALL